MGYISRGRGIAIHRRDCKNVIDHEGGDGRWIALSWNGMKHEQVYPVTIEVRGLIVRACYTIFRVWSRKKTSI